MSYQVGVDLGTTWTAAAVCREDGGTELVPLGERSPAVPSAVFVGDDGVFMIGEAAERRALSDPGRVVREFKRRIGDRTPLVVGGTPMAPEVLAARFVARILQHVADREGGPATRVTLTHPAGWGPHKLESLRAALTAAGLGAAELLPEPEAAAIGYADAARVEAGAVIAVYDLGGGTFDTAVVRKPDAGGFELLGRPEGLERLGGIDFDEVVFEHVRAELGTAWDGLDPSDPDVLAAVAALRQECTAAKEALSHDTEATIPVVLPGVHSRVRLERAAFEEMIRPAVAETATLLRRAIDSARLGPGAQPIVLLVGGSSRIPLVGRMIAEATGAPVAVDVDPKGVIATGAALAAHRADGGPAGAGALPAVTATAMEPVPPGDGAASAAAGPPPQPVPFGGVRPFRAPRTAPRRKPVVVIGVAAAIVAALAVGGGFLSGVYRTGTVTPTGPSAEASTPAAGTPQPGSGAGTKPPERGPVRQRPSGSTAASVPAPPAPPPAPGRAESVPTTPPSAPTSSSAPAPAPVVPPADESAGSGDPGSGGDTGGPTPPDPGVGGTPAQEEAPAGTGTGDNAGSGAGSGTGGPEGSAGDSSGAGTDPAGSGPAESTPGASGPGGGGPGAEAFTGPGPAPAAGPEQPGDRQPDAAASPDGAGPPGAGPPGAAGPAAEPGSPDGAAAGPSGSG